LILLKNKELRAVLSELQSGGILQVQEIPKSAGTERAKNYNLWSFHEPRARAFLLQDLYKTLIRIYQRIDEERVRKSNILAKASRTDVKKDLKRYLSKEEVKQYTEWRAIEERLLGQIMRVDRSVMLLRDV
jgi:DNA-directed RNA polymerase III subunit RPC3